MRDIRRSFNYPSKTHRMNTCICSHARTAHYETPPTKCRVHNKDEHNVDVYCKCEEFHAIGALVSDTQPTDTPAPVQPPPSDIIAENSEFVDS